jgi:hypothetical protein
MLVYCSERTWTPGYKGPMCRYVYSSVKGKADEMAGKAWLLGSPTAKQHRCAEDLGVQTQFSELPRDRKVQSNFRLVKIKRKCLRFKGEMVDRCECHNTRR